MCNRFDRIPACDGRTDGQTDGHFATARTVRSKNKTRSSAIVENLRYDKLSNSLLSRRLN